VGWKFVGLLNDQYEYTWGGHIKAKQMGRECGTRVRGDEYRSADKSLARPTSRCILFDGENISFDASLVIYINSTNIPPIMIINRIYENQNFLSL
jgi:hypothetical protein